MSDLQLGDRVRYKPSNPFASLSSETSSTSQPREGVLVDMGNGFLVCVQWDSPETVGVDIRDMTTTDGYRLVGFDRRNMEKEIKITGAWVIAGDLTKI